MEEIMDEYGELIIGVIFGGGLLGTIAALFLLPDSPFSALVLRFMNNIA